MSYSLVDPLLNEALISCYTEVSHFCWFSSSWNDSCSWLNDYGSHDIANLDYLHWEKYWNESSTDRKRWSGLLEVICGEEWSPVLFTVKYAGCVFCLNQSFRHTLESRVYRFRRKTWLFYDWRLKMAEKMAEKRPVKGGLVPHLLCSVGGQASQLVLCVPADNYLMPTESSIHCADWREMSSSSPIVIRDLRVCNYEKYAFI